MNTIKALKNSIPLNLRLRYHWLRRSCWYLSGIKSPETKFLILCTGRSGSTLLSNLLNSHPDIFCDGEIIDQKYAPNIIWPSLYLTAISKRATKFGNTAYGFKLKTDELGLQKYLDQKSLVHKLYNNGWKVIYLRRNNIINIAISQIKARHDQIWELHKRDNYVSAKIHVDPIDLITKIRQKEFLHKMEEDCLKDIPHFKLEYERDLLNNSWNKAIPKLFTYLDLKISSINTNMQKKSSENLSDKIVNYDEVKNFLIHEGYAHYINETHA